MELSIQYKHRRGTYDGLKLNNPVLLPGEIGIETDTRRFKIGDGSTAWNDKRYANSPLVEMGRAPNESDDTFEAGQLWRSTSGRFYILESVSPGAAVWKQVATVDDISGITLTGDVTGTVSIDGSGNASVDTTLSESGVVSGVYTKVSVDSKGRVISGSAASKEDVGLGNVIDVEQASKSEFDEYKVSVQSEMNQLESIAKGAGVALVFSTKTELDDWLEGTFTRPDGKVKADLLPGWNLYIVQREVPDYWWDGTQIQELETRKVDLTDYPSSPEVQAMLAAEVASLTVELNKKAPLSNPKFSDIPEAPTAVLGTETDQLATTKFVINELMSLVIDGGDLG